MSDSLLDLGTDPVFTASPNWQSSPSAGLDTGREVIQYNQAYASIRSLTLNNFRTMQYSYFNRTKAEEYYLLNFFYTQRGRLKRFWLPVNYQEFQITTAINSGDVYIYIWNIHLSYIIKGYERLLIVLKDGSMISRRILGCAEACSLPGVASQERLYLQTAIDRNIDLSDIRMAGLVFLVRFDQDEIELRHITDNLSECQVSFKELPDEYDL